MQESAQDKQQEQVEYTTIKAYAELQGVSYEAARQWVSKCEDELQGHVIKVGRTRFLDPAAIEILESKRKESPVKQAADAKNEQIERLMQENKRLLEAMLEKEQELNSLHKQIESLMQEKYNLLQDKQDQEQQRTGFFKRLFRN